MGADPALLQEAFGLKGLENYVCCFCGETIDSSDPEAVELIATNLWGRDVAQAVYSHSKCATQQMRAGQFSPDALLDVENNYSLQEVFWGEHLPHSTMPKWGCAIVVMILI